MLKRMAMVIVAAALAGCATGYGSSGFTGGHTVTHLEGDIYRVRFGGNGYTTRETVQTFWFHRASELALEKGFTGFQIMNMAIIGQSHLSYESDIRLVKGDYPHMPPVYFDAKVVSAGTTPYLAKEKRCDFMGNVCPHVKHYLQPVRPVATDGAKAAGQI